MQQPRIIYPFNGTERITVCGAGGFIGGHLVAALRQRGFAHLKAVDCKPTSEWCQCLSDLEMARVASKPNSYHLIAALTRLCGRNTTSGDLCKAEAIGLVVWHPATGTIDANWPPADSLLRIEKFSPQVEACYTYRFAGQPPHN
jgi:hypothetical protein